MYEGRSSTRKGEEEEGPFYSFYYFPETSKGIFESIRDIGHSLDKKGEEKKVVRSEWFRTPLDWDSVFEIGGEWKLKYERNNC